MKLTHHQKQAIYDQGFVKISGVVPQVMVEQALKAANHSIGEGMNKDDMITLRSRSYCPEIQSDPVITDLFIKRRHDLWRNQSSAKDVSIRCPTVRSRSDFLYFRTRPPHPILIWMVCTRLITACRKARS